jgi:hypothetical protein
MRYNNCKVGQLGLVTYKYSKIQHENYTIIDMAVKTTMNNTI